MSVLRLRLKPLYYLTYAHNNSYDVVLADAKEMQWAHLAAGSLLKRPGYSVAVMLFMPLPRAYVISKAIFGSIFY